ncbi:MAG: glycoside hydrolase family 3 C-terminal domain-containing protein [Micrococcales bacterium]
MPDPEGETFQDGQPRPPIAVSAPVDQDMLAAALGLAEQSDLTIAVVGDCIPLIGETKSTATLELLGSQVELLNGLQKSGKPYVVVVISSKPLVLPDSALKANALIQAFNPGMRGGQAIAELILGHIEPTGRLPISFAVHVGQQPTYYNQIRGQHGTRYADLTQKPQFPFGFGLSYTTVSYGQPRLAQTSLGLNDLVRASITLRNSGSRPALETVQFYVSDLVTSVTWAQKELKGYQQVWVQPGESVTVDFELPVSACTLVDSSATRVVEPGEFALLVGSSSSEADLQAVMFNVVGQA